MPESELAIIIHIPAEMPNEPLITSVRDNKSPLEILYERLTKIAPVTDMIFLTGHLPHHAPYGNYAALRGLFLFRTDESTIFRQIVRAASGRRMKTLIRVNAAHPFTDPEILQDMLEYHMNMNVAYTYLDGVPDFLGAEIYQRGELIDAYVRAERLELLDEQPGAFIRSQPELFKTAAYKPKIKGRWKKIDLSLDNPASTGFTIDTIRRAPNPLTVSYRDFLD
jgi:spore coat polysaccharide biosynthesis protein SpsF (cytidylyltransferase family)